MYDSNVLTKQTREDNLAKALGWKSVYLKREDTHPYGSHKGRSIPVMIDKYHGEGQNDFVISSSGNASLAAALHMKNKYPDATLEIFVGNNINPEKFQKLKSLENRNIRVLIMERPLQALALAVQNGKRSLRQSEDENALTGYEELARELSLIGDLSAIFIGTSSGTTAEALARFFNKSGRSVQIHIVQTTSCHPFFDAFENYDGPDEKSIADAIVDKTAYRKEALLPLIKESGGLAWYATNEEIQRAIGLTATNTSINISPNSALSVAGAMKAAYEGQAINGSIACIITGQ